MRTGDRAALEGVPAEDAVSYTDGGGTVHRTARRPIYGKDTVVRFLFGVAQWFWDDVATDMVEANGAEAALLRRNGTAFALLAVVTDERDQVSKILWIMAPPKLAALASGALASGR